MAVERAASWWIPALLTFASIGALCPKGTPPEESPNDAEIELATLSAQLSEPGGYFDTDNLISNESSYLQVADQLVDAVPTGGVYVGVGPEQNFSYIARLRPRYAFILDIRRQNLLQHLLFAAHFARADDPYHYLCLLFSRPCPSATPDGAWLGAERTLQALPPPSEAAFAANLRDAYQHIEGPLGFALSGPDRDDIRGIYRAFFEEQAEIRFRSFGRSRATHQPTYRTLLRARSPAGGPGAFSTRRRTIGSCATSRAAGASCPWSVASAGHTRCAPSAAGCARAASRSRRSTRRTSSSI
jgi:hypothetical protein